jgi:hypothetical protein
MGHLCKSVLFLLKTIYVNIIKNLSLNILPCVVVVK